MKRDAASRLDDDDDLDSVTSAESFCADRGSSAGGPAGEHGDSIAGRRLRRNAAQNPSNRTDDVVEEGDSDSESDDDNAADNDHEKGGDKMDSRSGIAKTVESGSHRDGNGEQDTIDLEREIFIKDYSEEAYKSARDLQRTRTVRACIIPAANKGKYSLKAITTNGFATLPKFRSKSLAHSRFRDHLIRKVGKAKNVSIEKVWNDVLKKQSTSIHIEVLRVKKGQKGGFSELEFKMTDPRSSRAAGSSCEPAPVHAQKTPARSSASGTGGPNDAGPTTPADGTAVKMGVDLEAELQSFHGGHAAGAKVINHLTKENKELTKKNEDLQAKCNELTNKCKAAEERRDEYKKRLHERVIQCTALEKENRKLDTYIDRYGVL